MKKALWICLLAIVFAGATEHPKADLVLRHGKVYKMDEARLWAESIAIQDGKITYVGDDSGITPWIGKETKSIELSGRFVLPGFIDSHVHPAEGGVGLKQCDLLPYDTKILTADA